MAKDSQLARVGNRSGSLREEVLFGRSGLLEDLATRLRSGVAGRRVLLRGPSGIGKSALLRALSDSSEPVCLHHELASRATGLHVVLSELAGQLMQQAELSATDPQRLRRALNNASIRHGRKLIAAMVTDLFAKLAPSTKETLGALLAEFAELDDVTSQQAQAQAILSAGRDDLLAAFFLLLEDLSAEGTSGCLLFDRVEAASESVATSLQAFVSQLPESWGLLLSVNDELPEGLETLHTLGPPLAYAEGEQVHVPPLMTTDLAEWCRHEGKLVPPPDTLQAVVDHTGGRPLFLADWVHGRSTHAVKASVVNRLSAYYEQRLNALSYDARRLALLLSLLPKRSSFPFSLCKELAREEDPLRVSELVDELRGKQLLTTLEGAAAYEFVHELIHDHISRKLPAEARQAAATEVLTALEAIDPTAAVVGEVARLPLYQIAGQQEDVLRHSLPAGQLLLASGAYAAAIEVLRMHCTAAKDSDSVGVAAARIRIATALLETGYYHEGLAELDQVPSEGLVPREIAELHLTHGRLKLRLNRYSDAMLDLRSAGESFEAADRVQGKVEAEKEANTILRDLGRYDEALAHASRLLETALREGVEPLVLASSYRALARSAALVRDTDRGVGAGRTALQIAVREESLRAEGNAHLAMAEAYRHGMRLTEAKEHYEQALRIAKRIGNTDSALWSALGLSDTLLLESQFESAEEVLRKVEAVVAPSPERHPLENLHWRFSLGVLAEVREPTVESSLEEIVQDYVGLGISWPSDYLAKLRALPRLLTPKAL